MVRILQPFRQTVDMEALKNSVKVRVFGVRYEVFSRTISILGHASWRYSSGASRGVQVVCLPPFLNIL